MNKKDELSLADLYLAFRDYGRYALRKWWLILIIVGGVVSGSVAWWFTQPSMYSARLTYLVEGSSGGGSAVLAQLGLGGSGEGPNIDRIEEIAKSDLVGIALLADTASISGQADLLGNHLINYSGLRELWEENGRAEEDMIYRPGPDSTLSRDQLALRKTLLASLFRNGGVGPLITIETDALTSLAKLTATTPDEEFSILLANRHFDQLQRFYFEKTQARQLSNIAVTEFVADSLEERINILQSEISRLQDRGQSMILNKDRLNLQRLTQDEQRTQLAYGETFKNLQIARFTLRTNRPNIEVIDRPFAPIYPYEYPLTELILIAGVVSVILAVAVVFLLFLRRNILNSLSETNQTNE